MRRLSVRTHLAIAFLWVCALLCLTAVTGVVATTSSTDAIRQIAREQMRLSSANQDLRRHSGEASGALRARINGESAAASSYVAAKRAWDEAMTAALAAAPDPTSRGLLDAQRRGWVAFTRGHADALVATPPSGDAGRRAYLAAVAGLDDFRTANDQLNTRIAHRVEEIDADASRRQHQILLGLVGVAVLGVAGCMVAARRTVNAVVPPLESLQAVLARLAGGDLAARTEVDGPLELAAVARSVDVLAHESQRMRELEQGRAGVRRASRELDRRMREHLHPDAVADEAVRGLGPAVGADRVHVRMVAEGRMGPVVAQWSIPSMPPLSTHRQLPVDHPLESAAALAAQLVPVVIEDVTRDPRTEGAVTSAEDLQGVRSLVVCPLVVGSEVIGVLVCARRPDSRPWGYGELGLVEAVGADMARAVHHARLFEQQSAIVTQLRELDRTKSDFLSTVSHELRTPLTSIAGYLEMLRDDEAGELAPMQRSMLDVIARNSQRLRDLIEDLLTISRVESGAVRGQRVPTALETLVEHAADALRPSAEQSGVKVDVIPPAQQAMVLGDPGQLERVVLNLVSNAVKFTPRGGRVQVTTEVRADEVSLQVTDTGIGIPQEEQAALFTRFFRATNASSLSIPGTGLGLAIVHSLVGVHDGRIEVDSAPGRGTTVTVTLPLLDRAALAAASTGLRRL